MVVVGFVILGEEELHGQWESCGSALHVGLGWYDDTQGWGEVFRGMVHLAGGICEDAEIKHGGWGSVGVSEGYPVVSLGDEDGS